PSAIVLTIFAAVVAALAWGMRRRERNDIALNYGLSGGGLMIAGALIALFVGFRSGEDALLATPVLVVDCAGLLAAAVILRRGPLALGGTVLLYLTCLQALGWNEWVRDGLVRMGIPTHRSW